ncbi:hypothetical protein ScPMuIL_008851 [Solemya velum]
MASSRMCRELPYQSFTKIKQYVLSRREPDGTIAENNLFVDPSFPPDLTSLTYVYSGDDRYERTIFKRPKEICKEPIFIGIGGLWEVPFPWRQWRKKSWFEAAVVIVSLSIHYLDKIIPGYKCFEQSFQDEYIGAFRFNLWRFGEWIEIVVDDNLPILDSKLMYSRMLGYPPEFWGLLLEKVYAKCKKTYEGIECGDTLDVLTDLTASVCEFYTPDVNPPENLFYILYTCSARRSMITCWRNEKLLAPKGFWFSTDDNKILSNETRFLHIVTATTKFPRTDGRIIEMLRLKCPYPGEPRWAGRFSDGDKQSWDSIDEKFLERFQPQSYKDEDEYWISMEDFRCHFGGLIVCTSCEPFQIEGFNVERMYLISTENQYNNKQNANEMRKSQAYIDHKENHAVYKSHKSAYRVPHQTHKKNAAFSDSCTAKRGIEINVHENGKTIKVDNTANVNGDYVKPVVLFEKRESSSSQYVDISFAQKQNLKYLKGFPISRAKSTYNAHGDTGSDSANEEKSKPVTRRHAASVQSNVFIQPESESTFSTSDISINVRENAANPQDSSVRRPSLPVNLGEKKRHAVATGYTKINFMAARTDHFQSHGSWKLIVEHFGRWKKHCSDGRQEGTKMLSENSRIPFVLTRPDATNQIIPHQFHGKCHVIISFLQDYRHGPMTANSLLVPIGFSIYKCKNPDKDKKRHVSKLHLVGQVKSGVDTREVNGRFDLDPGDYLFVAYCQEECHEGEFLVRIFGEKNNTAAKTGWYV